MKTISIYIRQILFICLICFGLVCYGKGQVSRPTNPQTQTSKPKKAASEVKISAPDGYINGHGYVDLGLPSGLKWAYSNLGATTPNEDGDRYARGEVKPKKALQLKTMSLLQYWKMVPNNSGNTLILIKMK